jgi:hypothetical protein
MQAQVGLSLISPIQPMCGRIGRLTGLLRLT